MTASDLFNQSDGAIEWLDFGDSQLGVLTGFVPSHWQLYHTLCNELVWDQPSVQLFGKTHKVPRLTAFYGDEGVEYRYSGLRHCASGWPPTLHTLNMRIDRMLQTGFNTVLLNWYRDGRDSMGFHADDEASLGSDPVIASVSLGAERRFVIKSRDTSRKFKREVFLRGGSLLVMAGKFQAEWLHGVPAEKSVTDGRINLTFRRVVT